MTGEYASFAEPGDVRLERILPAQVERVWAYLTEPALRATWLAGGEMDLRAGGRFEFRYDHALITGEAIPEHHRELAAGHLETGEITACDPPHLVAFTWGEARGVPSHVTIELSASGPGTRLVLTHRRLPPGGEMLITAASGWHAHLDVLRDRLRGTAARPFWANHDRLEAGYRRLLASA